LLVGDTPSKRSSSAWTQVYRALDHGPARKACRKTEVIAKFPKAIQDFANQFIAMQIKRHEADYDPSQPYYKSDVDILIASAAAAIKDFKKAKAKDRRAFAVWVLIKPVRQDD
jgi:hypothetical protein